MLLDRIDQRLARLIRLGALVAIDLSVLSSRYHPGTGGRELLVAVLFALTTISWLAWTIWPARERAVTIELYGLALAGGLLAGAAPDTAASAFVFVAVAAAGLRVEVSRALVLVALGALALGVTTLVYNGSGLGLLAYTLGFAATAFAASNSRQSVERAEQAELFLAQTQRSHEEQLRTARLEETTRIAREIHDVLAHALAGLTIQLEATTALLEQGADRERILERVQRAHALAREGLQETRRAVGALRGETVSTPAAIAALVDEYRAGTDAPAELTMDGDCTRLVGRTGEAVLRVVQEALTNVRKHAPGAGVAIEVHAGHRPDEGIVLRVDDRPTENGRVERPATLASTGGGYGLQGMRERAQLLGGTLTAGVADGGWCVELRLPPPTGSSASGDTIASTATSERTR
jgi:signal transduction histidine kinase